MNPLIWESHHERENPEVKNGVNMKHTYPSGQLNTRCPVCNSPAEITGTNTKKVNCLRCADFSITNSAEKFLIKKNFSSEQIAYISSWIREQHRVSLSLKDLKDLAQLNPPEVGKKGERLLKYLSEENPRAGDFIAQIYLMRKNDPDMLPYLGATWSVDDKELKFLFIDYLVETKQYIIFEKNNKKFKISPQGWSHLDSLKNKNEDSQIAFVAMSFKENLKPVYESIKSAILLSQYEPKCLLEHHHNNMIDNEIIASIKNSKFVVADLTNNKPNVYFEAGFAEGLGKEVIWTCKQSYIDKKRIHLDVRQFPYTTWKNDNLKEFEKQLVAKIIRTFGKGNYKHPFNNSK